jgi:hypothetical protein
MIRLLDIPRPVHTATLPNGQKIDVLRLQLAVAHLPVDNVPLRQIKGASNSRRSGFNGLRYALCDPGIPGIVDQKMRLLDGRHRYIRRRDAKVKHMPVRVATDEFIKSCIIKKRASK